MIDFTTNQWIIVLLVLLLGWLLGLMSRSSGRHWRRAYENEHAARTTLEKRFESERAAAPVSVRPVEAEHARPVAAEHPHATATPVPPATERSRGDDLTRVHGIGGNHARQLQELGIHRYDDIAHLSARDEAELERRLNLHPGQIERERWREQAGLLARGQYDEHRGVFG